MDKLTLAYLAGCMDSDGYFTIRVDTYQMRTGRAKSPTYQEQIGLRQVTPVVPELLHSLFGGSLYVSKPSAANGRPLHSWHVNSRKAAIATKALLPYLKIKSAQAAVILDLRSHKDALAAERSVNGTFADTLLATNDWRSTLRDRIKQLNTVGVPS